MPSSGVSRWRTMVAGHRACRRPAGNGAPLADVAAGRSRAPPAASSGPALAGVEVDVATRPAAAVYDSSTTVTRRASYSLVARRARPCRAGERRARRRSPAPVRSSSRQIRSRCRRRGASVSTTWPANASTRSQPLGRVLGPDRLGPRRVVLVGSRGTGAEHSRNSAASSLVTSSSCRRRRGAQRARRGTRTPRRAAADRARRRSGVVRVDEPDLAGVAALAPDARPGRRSGRRAPSARTARRAPRAPARPRRPACRAGAATPGTAGRPRRGRCRRSTPSPRSRRRRSSCAGPRRRGRRPVRRSRNRSP